MGTRVGFRCDARHKKIKKTAFVTAGLQGAARGPEDAVERQRTKPRGVDDSAEKL